MIACWLSLRLSDSFSLRCTLSFQAVAPRHLQQEIAKLTTSATEFLWMHRTNGTDKIQGSRRKFATRLFLMLTAKLHSLFGSVTEYQVFCLHARRLAVQLAKHKSKASKLVAEDAEMGSD